MADESSNYQNTQEQLVLEKELHKREQHLLGRLQEAHAAHTNALERSQRAEARLLKRVARVQRLEARLATLRQQIAELATAYAPSTGVDETLYADALREHTLSENMSDTPLLENKQDERSYVSETEADPQERARIARAVAEATEAAARLAVERAHGVAMRLAHKATGRHLVQELLLLEADAARASVEALDAELAAQEAEKLASAEPLDLSLPLDTLSHYDTPQALLEVSNDGEETSAQNELMPEVVEMSSNEEQSASTIETPENEGGALTIVETRHDGAEIPINSVETSDDGAEPLRSDEETGIHAGLPSAAERKRVAEIDEEEEMVEMVSSMMIADVAAANAAKAESLAEEASSHTREARRLAQEADTVLERIRTAVRNGSSTGDAAQAILFDAERDATHMHALLADAEAAEERARRFAMEAEADAEVAEGMAFAVGDRNEDAEKQREEEPISHPLLNGQIHTSDTGAMERLDTRQNVAGQKLEDEDTIETPIVQQQP